MGMEDSLVRQPTFRCLRCVQRQLLTVFTGRGQQKVPVRLCVQMRFTELLATTDGEWRRRHSLQRHKGGTWTAL